MTPKIPEKKEIKTVKQLKTVKTNRLFDFSLHIM